MIATVQIPKSRELLWLTIQAISSIGGSGSIQEIETKVAELGGFNKEQQTLPHKGGPQGELSYQQAWARTMLKAAGALDNQAGRGIWTLTEQGRRLTEADMPETWRQARTVRRVPALEAAARSSDTDDISAIAPPQVEDWQSRLLRLLLSMPPPAFERLCQRLLREAGFISVQITGRSGDGGIDGVGVLRINLLSFPVLFQCKRYSGSVSAPTVRDFRGAMVGRADKGLLITTGNFTADARREATRDGTPAIDLIDGSQLCDLLKERGLGVRTRMIEVVDVDSDWFNAL